MINKIKLTLGIALILVGLIWECHFYYEFVDNGIDITDAYITRRIRSTSSWDGDPNVYTPVNYYHHFLFGFSMLSGSILIASIKQPEVSTGKG